MLRKKRILWTGLGLMLWSTGHAQVTVRVSVDSAGAQANGASFSPSTSADGNRIAFMSFATNLCTEPTNFLGIFVHDRRTGITECASISTTGVQGNMDSRIPSISADGRYVAFESDASNLVPGDTNGGRDIFVRDFLSGTTERVSVGAGGTQANDISLRPSVSGDGRYVAFSSWASNLVPGDTNGDLDIFVRDRLAGTTERVSLDAAGLQVFGGSDDAVISADGRYVAFLSGSPDFVPGDTNGIGDVFVRDRLTGTTERVNLSSAGAEANGGSISESISADGRYVAFQSLASNLVSGDTNGTWDAFVHDRLTGATERVSVDSAGGQGSGNSESPSISSDGHCVAFASNAYLGAGTINGHRDVYVRDRMAQTTERVSVDSAGVGGNDDSAVPSISGDGHCVAFISIASNLVPWDTDFAYDIFLRDRQLVVPAFTSLCEPGSGDVIGCPCSNPPTGADRGCDNASASGGASLAASGSTQLSGDGLVFTTSGEMPSALSVLVQGNAFLPAGVVYGQGVRCIGGRVLRLYKKNAESGVIQAPDRMAGDPPVSVQSARKADIIQPGQSRWYAVFYRDPTVLGSCPAGSTFNSTQVGEISWTF